MGRALLASLVVVCVCARAAAPVAFAGVISHDWKSPGDGLLTYDDVNQREWLDLSQTLLSSQFPGADREAKFQFVMDQTGGGGLFDGFSIAQSSDVVALVESAGIDSSTQSYAINAAPTLALGALLTFTIEAMNGNRAVVGIVDGIDSDSLVRTTAFLRTSFASQAGLSFGTPHTEFNEPPGVMLYRKVPEPAGIALLAVGLSALRGKKHWARTE